ncbi:DoxX family protein [Aquabacterium sp.]|uniref:DoxX family protein n=1 Tax=Aquabacterium sp. TaxID=1872578 RepID=UPI001986701F|nr:DoxX family protein [Aquabacterium sp.]MBC7700362.1 DoxX family protein [Aquabacterium sp.]
MTAFIERWIEPAVHLARRGEPWAQALALLAARLYLLDVFFKSGLTKLQDWDSTLFLFAEEYHVPVLPPELAAWMGTGGELVFSVLLAVGLFSRPAALGVFFLNAVAAYSYPDISAAGLKDHVLWGVLSFALVLFGPGRLALDAWVMPRWLPSLRER